MTPGIHLFVPCYVNALFPEVGRVSFRLLEMLGYRVTVPLNQTCCGQPAFNTGYFSEAATLARRMLNIFKEAEYIVAPSGSCVAMVKHCLGMLPLSPRETSLWRRWRNRCYELSQFMVQVAGVRGWRGVFPHTVAYHDACHALRELGIHHEPRALLTGIDRLRLVEMPEARRCCGFGGMFAVKFSRLSTALLEQKIASLLKTKAEFVVSTDAGCLMHIGGYLWKHRLAIRPLHLAELLWQAQQLSTSKGRLRHRDRPIEPLEYPRNE